MKTWLLALAALFLAQAVQTSALAGCKPEKCQEIVQKILYCVHKEITMDFKKCRQPYRTQVLKNCDCHYGFTKPEETLTKPLTYGTDTGEGQNGVNICGYCAQNSVSLECQEILNFCAEEER